jgi:O-antigen biosynthesis protein WbqP
MYENIFKRLIDLIIAIICIALFSPIYLILFLIIYLGDFQTPIFKQNRVGRNKEVFTLYKFRSMPINTGDVASSEVSKIKVTKVGKFIRRTNLDELPQVFNVLFGDMSFIGPRPSITSQNDLITLRDKSNVYKSRPGLTGYAQINSYDFMPITQKVEFDAEYVKRVSFLLDVKIFLRTFIYLTKKPPTY